MTATAGLVAALRGETEAARRLIGELRNSELFPGMPFATVMAQQVDGLLALLDGRTAEAYEILARVFDPADPHHHSVSCWLVAPDLADAAVAAGTVGQARNCSGTARAGPAVALGDDDDGARLHQAVLAQTMTPNSSTRQRWHHSPRDAG